MKELAIAGCVDILYCGNWCNDVFETVNCAALHVHAKEHGERGSSLAIAQQLPCLFWRFNVAGEEDDSAGLERRQGSPQVSIYCKAIKTHDEQLANLLAQIKTGCLRHSVDYKHSAVSTQRGTALPRGSK